MSLQGTLHPVHSKITGLLHAAWLNTASKQASKHSTPKHVQDSGLNNQVECVPPVVLGI